MFAQVGPNREAFQPGTQPSARVVQPVLGGGVEPVTPFNPAGTPQPARAAPTPAMAPPPRPKPPKPPSELNGLF